MEDLRRLIWGSQTHTWSPHEKSLGTTLLPVTVPTPFCFVYYHILSLNANSPVTATNRPLLPTTHFFDAALPVDARRPRTEEVRRIPLLKVKLEIVTCSQVPGGCWCSEDERPWRFEVSERKLIRKARRRKESRWREQ